MDILNYKKRTFISPLRTTILINKFLNNKVRCQDTMIKRFPCTYIGLGD